MTNVESNKSRKEHSYVGVSGVAQPYQARALVSMAKQSGLLKERCLLLGVKATHKTQMEDIENKYGNEWYPVGDAIRTAMPSRTPECVHPVAQVYMEKPHDREYRDLFTSRLEQRTGSWLHGVQYDLLPWHELDLTDYLMDVYQAGYTIYLQAHSDVMDLGPDEAVEAFAPYAEMVDTVLFDASHGTGKHMDADRLSEFLDAFSEFEVGMGVAGGLGRDHMPLAGLLEDYPNLSWDAEGALHPVNSQGNRRLDLGLAENYLRTSARLIQDSVLLG